MIQRIVKRVLQGKSSGVIQKGSKEEARKAIPDRQQDPKKLADLRLSTVPTYKRVRLIGLDEKNKSWRKGSKYEVYLPNLQKERLTNDVR